MSVFGWSSARNFAISWCLMCILFPHLKFLSIAIAQISEPSAEKEKNICIFYLEKETQKKWDDSIKACASDLGLASTNSTVPDGATNHEVEGFLDKEADDKCFYECVYKKLDLLSDTGKVKENGGKIVVKSNMTEAMMVKAVKFWDDCIDEIATNVKTNGLSSCKGIQLHFLCFIGKQDETFLRDC